ncbi:MAG: hypothetical protein R3D43_08835 [Tepidamorphaceae bacterium]
MPALKGGTEATRANASFSDQNETIGPAFQIGERQMRRIAVMRVIDTLGERPRPGCRARGAGLRLDSLRIERLDFIAVAGGLCQDLVEVGAFQRLFDRSAPVLFAGG